MHKKVLACIDHSTYSPAVCDCAAWAALRLNAPLEFIHVLDRHPEIAQKHDLSGSIGLGAREALLEDLAALDEKRSKIAFESGRLLLEGAKQRAISDGVAAPESRQRHGELVETLAELEKDARLFVLGKRGEAAENAPEHIGSNLERVVRALHRPILVVAKEFKPPSRFAIAFDNSMTTRKGVEMIASSPLFKEMTGHVVMAGATSSATNQKLAWARDRLNDGGIEVKAAVAVDGDAEIVISEYIRANQIELLVMGAYGHSRIRQLLVGSTTTAMIRTSSIPLLLLR